VSFFPWSLRATQSSGIIRHLLQRSQPILKGGRGKGREEGGGENEVKEGESLYSSRVYVYVCVCVCVCA
jgi:hypothetical protein